MARDLSSPLSLLLTLFCALCVYSGPHLFNLYPELLANVVFKPVPVDDFSFSVHHATEHPQAVNQDGPAILFCIDGTVSCSDNEQTLVLKPGDSVFVGAEENDITVSGNGRIARAYAEL